MNYRDEKLFAALARVAGRLLTHFNSQAFANTVWACATVKYRDEQLFADLARVAKPRLSDFNP